MQYEEYKTESERERETIKHLINFKSAYGYSPSYSELAKLMDVSKSRVAQIIDDLEQKKLISKDGSKARTIQVLLKV